VTNTVKSDSCFGLFCTCFGHKDKTGQERNLVIFKELFNNLNVKIYELAIIGLCRETKSYQRADNLTLWLDNFSLRANHLIEGIT